MALPRNVLCFFLLSAASLFAQDPEEWHRPFPPHRIAGNIYYVGTEDLASFLVAMPVGNILINTDYERDVPLIRESVTELGFKFGDIRIVLLSRAHDDHVAGTAAVIQQTGAKLMVMRGDVQAMEIGTTDFQPSDQHWKPVKVTRTLNDGDTVRLGDVVLTAHLTAGHTKGCTTWTTTVIDAGRRLNVVIDCSLNVIPAYRLINDPVYPDVTQDFEKTFAALKLLPCDVFLSAHATTNHMTEKYARLGRDGKSPFIDPGGYLVYVNDREGAFRRELERQTTHRVLPSISK